jgi:transmembrane sensor
MNASKAKATNGPSAAARAEAAAWIARLHGPNRSREVEAGLRRWLAEDPERAAAFELMTDTWEKSARLRRNPGERPMQKHDGAFRVSPIRAFAAAAAVAVFAVLGTLYFFHESGVRTGVGEQRTLVLEDGSRIVLNTATRVAIDYDRHRRRVELTSGEALFEVAKQPNRPFVVVAGDQQVIARGTAFMVRKEDRQLAVTLMEGKVEVGAVTSEPVAATTLHPGERLIIAEARPATLDRPVMDRITAWQRGHIALDNTRLADAVIEMNRYAHIRLVVDGTAANIPVSGTFRAGASADFAQAVARTFNLRVTETEQEIVLSTR